MKKEFLKNKLSEVKAEIAEKEWDEISSRLRRRMFFRFNKDSFNIYYLTAGLCALGLYSYLLMNINGYKDDHNLKGINQIDTIYIRDTIYIKELADSENPKKIKKSKNQKQISQISSDQLKMAVPNVSNLSSIKDTSENKNIQKPDSSSLIQKKAAVQKNKKIKYVTLRDTIYQIDTSFVKKKKK